MSRSIDRLSDLSLMTSSSEDGDNSWSSFKLTNQPLKHLYLCLLLLVGKGDRIWNEKLKYVKDLLYVWHLIMEEDALTFLLLLVIAGMLWTMSSSISVWISVIFFSSCFLLSVIFSFKCDFFFYVWFGTSHFSRDFLCAMFQLGFYIIKFFLLIWT